MPTRPTAGAPSRHRGRPARLPARPAAARRHRLWHVHEGRRRRGRRRGRRGGSRSWARRSSRHANAELGDTIVGTFERDRGRADGPRHRAPRHRLRARDGRRAALRHPRRTRLRSRRQRHEGRPPDRPLRAGGAADPSPQVDPPRRPTARSAADWLPVGRLVFIANPDEEIGSPIEHAGHRGRSRRARMPPSSSRRPARTATSSPRGRATGRSASTSTGARPTPASSRRRAAAPSWRPRTRSCALHALNGRWPGRDRQRRASSRAGRGRTSSPRAPSSRSTCGPCERRRPGGRRGGHPAIADASTRAGRDAAPSRCCRGTGPWSGPRPRRGSWSTPSRLAAGLGFELARCRHRRRLGRQHDEPAWASPPSTVSGPSVAWTMPPVSTWSWTPSCRARRCWPGCWRPSATDPRCRSDDGRPPDDA